MNKRVILITGTPAVGKTTVAKELANSLNALYINLTELAKTENLIIEEDKQRKTATINETRMRRRVRTVIDKTDSDIIIDGHYAAAVTPKPMVTNVFVLRRHPEELRKFMIKRGYTQAKQQENLEAEILDVCLVEALQKQPKGIVCEIDTTNKTPFDVLAEIVVIIEGKNTCRAEGIDWLGKLEREGKLDLYLKTQF